MTDYGKTVRCGACGISYKQGAEPDPCLGYLPSVTNACCGHGTSEAYVSFNNGITLRAETPFTVDKNQFRANRTKARIELDKLRSISIQEALDEDRGV